jgi:hypothetical protein
MKNPRLAEVFINHLHIMAGVIKICACPIHAHIVPHQSSICSTPHRGGSIRVRHQPDALQVLALLCQSIKKATTHKRAGNGPTPDCRDGHNPFLGDDQWKRQVRNTCPERGEPMGRAVK